jgi:hypothetical protein
MQSRQYSGFNVWLCRVLVERVGTPVDHRDTATLQFLARYLKKAPLFNQRIELLEEVHLVRYAKYSARTRGATKNKAALITNSASLTNPDVQADKPKPSKTWAQCMKLVF